LRTLFNAFICFGVYPSTFYSVSSTSASPLHRLFRALSPSSTREGGTPCTCTWQYITRSPLSPLKTRVTDHGDEPVLCSNELISTLCDESSTLSALRLRKLRPDNNSAYNAEMLMCSYVPLRVSQCCQSGISDVPVKRSSYLELFLALY
jgi:hypothetical protein